MLLAIFLCFSSVVDSPRQLEMNGACGHRDHVANIQRVVMRLMHEAVNKRRTLVLLPPSAPHLLSLAVLVIAPIALPLALAAAILDHIHHVRASASSARPAEPLAVIFRV